MPELTIKPFDERENIYNEENFDVIVQTDSSENTLRAAKGLVDAVGDIEKIIHHRNVTSDIYKTYIFGKNMKVLIYNGFFSGKRTEETDHFLDFLNSLGIDKEEIDAVNQQKDPEQATITFEF